MRRARSTAPTSPNVWRCRRDRDTDRARPLPALLTGGGVVSRHALVGAFKLAREHRDNGVAYLRHLRAIYIRSDEPDRLARVAALDAKIDALQAVQLNWDAHPWVEDWR